MRQVLVLALGVEVSPGGKLMGQFLLLLVPGHAATLLHLVKLRFVVSFGIHFHLGLFKRVLIIKLVTNRFLVHDILQFLTLDNIRRIDLICTDAVQRARSQG